MLGIMNHSWSISERILLNQPGKTDAAVPLIARLCYLCKRLKPGHFFVRKSEIAALVSQALVKRVEWPKFHKAKYRALYPILNVVFGKGEIV